MKKLVIAMHTLMAFSLVACSAKASKSESTTLSLGGGARGKVTITLKNASDQAGRRVKERMQAIFADPRHDLGDYMFKRSFVIEPGEGSFSGEEPDDPITIDSALDRDNDSILLMTILHEESHWSEGVRAMDPAFDLYKSTNEDGFLQAIEDAETMFPDIPTTYAAGGAGDAHKTFLHVVVNFLELQAGKRFLGEKTAYQELCASPVYSEIYKTVIKHERDVAGLLKKHKLLLEPWSKTQGYACPQGGGGRSQRA